MSHLKNIPALVLILLLVCSALPTVETSIVGEAQQTATISTYVNSTAVIETNYGTIKFMLYDHGVPITTANFIKLADSGFYDGCLFHRVIDDFVIQGGDPNSKDNIPQNDGMGGSGETIPLEINPELTHIDGAVGMARSEDPNSASSQFYICDGAQHQLDGDYSVFGVVNDDASMEVVRTIASVETWGYVRPLLQDRPIEDVVMEKVYTEHGYYENITMNIPTGNNISYGILIVVIIVIAAAVIGYKMKLFRWLRSKV